MNPSVDRMRSNVAGKMEDSEIPKSLPGAPPPVGTAYPNGFRLIARGDTLQSAMADDKLQVDVFDGSRPGEKVVVLEGVLNAETSFRFRDFVRKHEPPTLVIDMSRVRYVDSSGMGVLIGTYVTFERNCRRLLLAGLNDRIWDLFRVCKIEDVFTRYPTVVDAEQTIPMSSEGVESGSTAGLPKPPMGGVATDIDQ